MLLEKRFNFHIPIRWHLVSQLVGEGLKLVGRAVPRALAFGHSPESGAFPWEASAGGGAFALGREGWRLDAEQLLPSRGGQSCVRRGNGYRCSILNCLLFYAT